MDSGHVLYTHELTTVVTCTRLDTSTVLVYYLEYIKVCLRIHIGKPSTLVTYRSMVVIVHTFNPRTQEKGGWISEIRITMGYQSMNQHSSLSFQKLTGIKDRGIQS